MPPPDRSLLYEELTFPEAGQLPRDIPLVLPLGDAPVRPGEVALPRVPFGWTGPLRCPSFEPLLQSVVSCLQEDGFRNIEVRTGACSINLPAPERRVALLAIGHTEQHGYHLPLATDTIIAEAMVEGVTTLRPEQVWALPVWPYGVSTHRREFAGTLSCHPRRWEDFWVEVLDVLVASGFRMAYLINGHGGNHSFLVNVTKFAGERHPRCFLATSFLHTSSGKAAELLYGLRTSRLMGHACELETSYMLALRPDLVHLERAVDELDFISTGNYWMDWIEAGALIANPPWSDDTRSGSYGAPSCATAEKGRAWLEAARRELAGHVDEIQEQWSRRRQRTSSSAFQTGSQLAPGSPSG